MSSKDSEQARALKQFIKTKASLKDEPVVIFNSGDIYRQVTLTEGNDRFEPTGGRLEPFPPILKFAGFSIGRGYYVDADEARESGKVPGYYFQSRTIMLYLDPVSGKLIDHWENPWIPRNPDGTGGFVPKAVAVHHVQLPIGNQIFSEAGSHYVPRRVSLGSNKIVYRDDVFLKYQSCLAGDAYRRFSAGDIYQSVEILHYYANLDELLDDSVGGAQDVLVSWVRLGPYLPWMHMGAAPGRLMYVADGYKVAGGFEGLPDWIKAEVRAKYPMFEAAPQGPYPEKFVNDSSWTIFKKALDNGEYVPTPIP